MTRLRLWFTGVVAVAAAAAIATSASGAPATSAQACVAKKNVEAIVDDSGSMSLTDSNRLRVQALNLVMSTPGNESKTLGAIQFGTDASSVFDPGPINTNRSRFAQTLNQQIQADDGGTNYNAAFALAKTHNANADVRIFLTDGANNGTYDNGHVGGPTTDVIGLGASIAGPDEARLKQIAADTGGIYRKANDASQLQAAMNDINASINCSQPPVAYTDTFTKAGQAKQHSLKVPRGIRSVQFALSWAETADSFDIGGFKIVRKGKVVARSAKVRRLKVKKRKGATFVTVKVSKIVPGKLRFKVRARKVASSTFTGVKLITQASRSKRR
jgi:VWA domain-containing protein